MRTTRTLGWLLLFSACAVGAQPSPPAWPLSDQYSVLVGEQRLPLLKSREDSAARLDKDGNGLITPEEFAVWTENMPGGLKVDVEDYVRDLAHEFTGTPSPYVGRYPDALEVERRLRAAVGESAGRARLEKLGESAEGRPIWAARVGREGAPRVVIVAQQHAREWMSLQVALAILDALLTDPAQAPLTERLEIWLVPLANPDGYEYSRSSDPGWRKSRRVTGPNRAPGVDLNRNFPADYRRSGDLPERTDDDWGASDLPRSGQYRGPGPASEPETRALIGLLDRPGLIGVLDLHGFGCKIVQPGEDSTVPQARYQKLGAGMLEALGPDYETLRFGDLYPLTGSLASYADRKGVPGLTLELGKAFRPHPDKMEAVVGQGVRGALSFARALIEP